MSLRLFRSDDPSERETEALLAWYVNGTLDASEHARVERHLTECLRCRREAERLRELQAAVTQEISVPALERALAGAHARLDEFEQRWRPAALMQRLGKSWRAAAPAVRAALAVQLALIIGLALALTLSRESPAPYRTLSAPAVTTREARQRFSLSLTARHKKPSCARCSPVSVRASSAVRLLQASTPSTLRPVWRVR